MSPAIATDRAPTILDALAVGNLLLARDLILDKIEQEAAGRNSWDSPQFAGPIEVQEQIELNYSRNRLMTFFGLETLRDRYFLKDDNGNIVEEPQSFYARVSAGIAVAGLTKTTDEEYLTEAGDVVPITAIISYAQELYEIISKHWFSPATPVLTNSGTNKGLPISCFLNTVGDSLQQIYGTFTENAYLAAGGGGIGTSWRDVRGLGGKLTNGGKSSGTIPFIKIMDSSCLAVSQGNTRRGAAACYQNIDHPDIEEFVDIRRPTGGDENRRSLNLHHGVCVTDKFMEAVRTRSSWDLICPTHGTVEKTIDAWTLWKKILKNRVETGEPYIVFIDTVNKATPAHHKDKGLYVEQSNLCTEITLATSRDRTAVCCLGSLNLERYEEWKDEAERVIYVAVRALDNVLQNFIDQADQIKYAKAIRSARMERSIGLGVMGWHSYLMKKHVPFGSVVAKLQNKQIFANIQKHALAASERLGVERGICPDAEGTDFKQRNSYVLSIAPTANISNVCGGASPGIEPLFRNAFVQKTLSGTFFVKNPHLEKILEQRDCNTIETWKSIIQNDGSVQHLDCLTDEDKKVFKTAFEINPRTLIDQAAERQPYICQAQSLNLFFSTPVSGKFLHQMHFRAWEAGVKSLYYLRSSSVLETDSVERKAIRKQIEVDECEACQ